MGCHLLTRVAAQLSSYVGSHVVFDKQGLQSYSNRKTFHYFRHQVLHNLNAAGSLNGIAELTLSTYMVYFCTRSPGETFLIISCAHTSETTVNCMFWLLLYCLCKISSSHFRQPLDVKFFFHFAQYVHL